MLRKEMSLTCKIKSGTSNLCNQYNFLFERRREKKLEVNLDEKEEVVYRKIKNNHRNPEINEFDNSN